MKTYGSGFELIMQEVLKQKQLLEDLQTENGELLRQLANLREGRGISVDILGNRFPLVGELASGSPDAVATVGADLSLQETTVIHSETLPSSLPKTPLPAAVTAPNTEEVLEDQKKLVTPPMSAFLEEALLDEFSTASTRQMVQPPQAFISEGPSSSRETTNTNWPPTITTGPGS